MIIPISLAVSYDNIPGLIGHYTLVVLVALLILWAFLKTTKRKT